MNEEGTRERSAAQRGQRQPNQHVKRGGRQQRSLDEVAGEARVRIRNAGETPVESCRVSRFERGLRRRRERHRDGLKSAGEARRRDASTQLEGALFLGSGLTMRHGTCDHNNFRSENADFQHVRQTYGRRSADRRRSPKWLLIHNIKIITCVKL